MRLVSAAPRVEASCTSALETSSSARVTSLVLARPASARALASSRLWRANSSRCPAASKTCWLPSVERKASAASKPTSRRASRASSCGRLALEPGLPVQGEAARIEQGHPRGGRGPERVEGLDHHLLAAHLPDGLVQAAGIGAGHGQLGEEEGPGPSHARIGGLGAALSGQGRLIALGGERHGLLQGEGLPLGLLQRARRGLGASC